MALVEPGIPAHEERPLRELVAKLQQDGSLLMQQEVALAKKEVQEKLGRVKKDVTAMAIGGAVLYAGVLTLLAAVVLLLAGFMPAWLSAFIVGAIVTGVGAAMSLKGKKDIADVDVTPEQSVRSVRTDLQVMKEAVR